MNDSKKFNLKKISNYLNLDIKFKNAVNRQNLSKNLMREVNFLNFLKKIIFHYTILLFNDWLKLGVIQWTRQKI